MRYARKGSISIYGRDAAGASVVVDGHNVGRTVIAYRPETPRKAGGERPPVCRHAAFGEQNTHGPADPRLGPPQCYCDLFLGQGSKDRVAFVGPVMKAQVRHEKRMVSALLSIDAGPLRGAPRSWPS